MITNYSKMLRQPQSQHNVEPVKTPQLRNKKQTLWAGFALIMMLCFVPLPSLAQSIANYTFSTATNGSLDDLSVGATVLMTGNNDDVATAIIPIGFDFYFMGNRYTHFSANTNGQVRLHQSAIETAISGGNISGPSSNVATLFPMSGDNEVNGGMKLKRVGTKLVIEWNQFYVYYTNITNAGDMQLWLHQDGKIEYVYGEIYNSGSTANSRSIGLASSNTATTAGSITLSAAPTFTAAAAFTANSFAAGSGTTTGSPLIANLGSSAQGSRRVFSFIPVGGSGNSIASVLAPPTALNFTAVGSVGMTLNWTAATPVTGVLKYAIYNSTDGVNFNFVNTTNVGTNTYVVGSLLPNTNYTWKIFSISEGGKSTEVVVAQGTPVAGSNSAVASGNWSNPATWSSGIVPDVGQNVTIPAGITVTQDAAAAVAYSLTLDGNLVYAATAANLVVGNDVTINSTGTLSGPATGTVVTSSLNISGNLLNNGVLDLSTNANTAGVVLTFSGTQPTNFTGTGTVNDLYSLSISKSALSVLVDVNVSNFTVRGLSTAATGSLLGSSGTGTLKFSGTNTFDGTLWNNAGFTIAGTFGFWLNNPNFTVNGLAGTTAVQGLFRVSAGTYNIGTTTGSSLTFNSNSTVIIEGGTVNSTSRVGVVAAANTVNFTQTGGTINVNSISNTSTTLASFDLGTSTTSTVVLTGGSVNVILANTATSGPRDVRGFAGLLPLAAGTTFNFGTAASGAAKTFNFSGSIPSFVINNASANHSLSLSGAASTFANVTVPAGSTLNLNGNVYTNRGPLFTNNGTLTGTSSSSNLYFLSNVASGQTYAGSGTVTPGLTILTVNTGVGNLTLDPSITGINALRVNLITGTVVNSGKFTIGSGAALAASVFIGEAALETPGGNFDAAPIFNLGTGAFSVNYLKESVARTSGFEIPSTRTVNAMTVNNTNGVVLAGGPVDVLTTLTLTAGNITTTDTNYLGLGSPTVAGTLSGGSASSFINGPFRRTFATRTATGTYSATTLFPVGKGALYIPMHIDPTVTGPVVMSGEAFATNSGALGGGVETLGTNRWEGLIKSGSSNFTSSFIRLSDGLSISTNKILQANSAAAAYGSILPATNFVAATPNTLTTGTAITAANYLGYFSYGNLNICPMPTSQATTFVASAVGSTFFSGSFTAATDSPSHYLVVRYASGATPVNPVDYTTYTVGGTLGTGTVVAVLAAPNVSFAQTGLTAGTTYNYYIYSYNNVSCYGPAYNVTTPLMGAVTTCAAAATAPSALVSSVLTTNTFTLGWTAVATSSLLLDVATNNTFTTFVPGYNAKPLAAGVTSEIVSGLTAATPYYVRLRAIDGTCYSNYSSTLTVMTECNPEVAPTVVQTFADFTGSAPSPICWSEKTGTLAVNSTLTLTNSAWFNSTGFANAGSNVGVKINLYSTKNDWIISNPIDLGTTPKRLVYDMAVTSYNGTTAQTTLATHKVDVVVSTDGGLTWSNANSVKSYTGAGTYSATGQQQIINLNAYSGVVKIAFVATTSSTSPDIDFHIDNFKVENIQTPTIANFSSTVACGDATVLTITGTSFTGASVTINGTAFTPTSVSDTQITIPVSAATNGNIVVTTLGGTATSASAFSFSIAPALTLSATSTAICSGSSSTLVSVTDGTTDYDTFVWSPATGVTGNATSGYTFNATASGVYTLTATQSAGSCSRTTTFNLTVNPMPSDLVVTPLSSVVCQDSVIGLSATGGLTPLTLLNETFDSGTTLPSSLTAVAEATDQIIVVNAQTAGGTGNQLRIVGNSQTNSITDRVSAGPFNTVGMPSLTLSWRNFLNHYSSTKNYSVSIQTSTDGVTWNTTSWSTNPVTASQDASQQTLTINNADVGSATFYVAFTVSGQTFGMHNWNIDDILLTGTATGNVIWSPTTDLYTDAAATVAYTGTAATTVYVKGSTVTPASYTAVFTNSSSCSVSATANVTVTTNTIPDFAAIPAFCSGATAPVLATTSPNGVAGTWSPATVSNTANGTYVFTPNADQCATTQTLTVTVNTTAAPTGTSPQDYATGGTLADFDVTGTGIIWYDAETAGNVLPETTLLVSGVTYYASQTQNGCESPIRLAVTAGTNLKVDGFDFNSLKYYPNPVNNVLTVSYSQEITGLKLYNMVGQQLIAKKVNTTETQLDMSHLPAGSYLLEVSSGSKSKMVKLLKNQ